MEATDPEHTYRYFPNQHAWTWEQETGNTSSMAGGWCEVHAQYRYKADDWDMPSEQPGEHRARDNGWPGRASNRVMAAHTSTANQNKPCTNSRQRRLDEFLPRAANDGTQAHIANVYP